MVACFQIRSGVNALNRRFVMATSREEFREQLVAAVEAAPELPREDRQYLADVFLDRLNAEYDLVPRGTGRRPLREKPDGKGAGRVPWLPIALLLAFLIFVIPAAIHHVLVILVIVAGVFLAIKAVRSCRSSIAASQ
jgi:hypothetical protein